MEDLEAYYTNYQDGSFVDINNIEGGYICSSCGKWIYSNSYHSCYPVYPYPDTYINYYPYGWTSYPSENKTEKAFKILKLLVKEKIIQEPNSFKKFCDLIEKIAKVV